MELIKTNTHIDFMGKRRLALTLSSLLIVISLVSLATRGLNYGIDFTGGTLIEVGYPDTVDLEKIRADLTEGGFAAAIVQYFGTTHDVLVRLAPRADLSKAEFSSRVLRVLRQSGNDMQLRRVEFVGPQVGDELTEQGGLAMLIVLGAILIYVSLRFQWKFSLGAVAALFHDVIITLGFFSILALEFDLTVLAAVLAVIGYSLNDTIVVFDRVRENFRIMRRGAAIDIFNVSLNQTLSRTLMTSFTTVLVLIALFFLGGEIIHDFAIALIVGIVIGTYSSIYVASVLALALGVIKADLMPVVKEGDGADARP